MASINLSGILRDPLGEVSFGNKVRFTHTTTTGETLKGFRSIKEVVIDGAYDIDLEYGNVSIETFDKLNRHWVYHGNITINSDTPATSLPALLGITIPSTDADLLVFQALVADAESAALSASISATEAGARLASYEIDSTDELINGFDSSPLAIGSTLKTLGFYSANDGGGGTWEKTAITGSTSQTPTQLVGAVLNDSTGAQWSLKTPSYINVRQLGAYPTGLLCSAGAFNAGLAALKDVGGTLRASGNFIFDTYVSESITEDLYLSFEGAKLTCTESFPQNKFFNVSGDEIASLTIEGGKFDVKNQPNSEAGQANDCLYLTSFDSLTVRRVSLHAGDAFATAGSDSGIFGATCKKITIENSRFRGFPDSAIYLSANGDGEGGENYSVTNNRFWDCNNAFISKRRAIYHVVSGNTIKRCFNGIVQGSAGDPLTLPGRVMVISNNIMNKVNRGIEIRYNDNAAVVGNIITEIGYTESGTPIIGTGIWLAGASNCNVTGNVISEENEDATPTSSFIGIRLTERAETGYPTMQSTNNHISNNTLNVNRAYQEFDSSNNNNFSDNKLGPLVLRSRVIIGATSTEQIMLSSGNYQITTGGGQVTTFLVNGNVGVGTTNPSRKLTVIDSENGAIAAAAGTNMLVQGDANGYISILSEDNGFSGLILGSASDNNQAMVRLNQSTGVLELKSDGLVGFGSHSPITSESVSGYITVADSSGVTRKIAIVS